MLASHKPLKAGIVKSPPFEGDFHTVHFNTNFLSVYSALVLDLNEAVPALREFTVQEESCPSCQCCLEAIPFNGMTTNRRRKNYSVKKIIILQISKKIIDSGKNDQRMLKLWGENVMRTEIFVISKYLPIGYL